MRLRTVLHPTWVLLVLASGSLPAVAQTPLGTGFTYQGQLKLDGGPLNDTADLEFSLWDAPGADCPPVGGAQMGVTQTVSDVTVSDGLFTVELNAGGQFGASAFDGSARWLEVAVRSPAGGGEYTAICPRQTLTAVPYALTALSSPGVFNILSFGATRNDPDDDRPAFLAAVAAARDYGGGVIYIPPGEYVVAGPIDLSGASNLRIMGSGRASVLMADSDDYVLGGGGVTGVEVSGFQIQGQFAKGLSFSTTSFLRISDLDVRGATRVGAFGLGGQGILLDNVNDAQVMNSYFSGNGLGPDIQGSSDILVNTAGGSRIRIEGNTCLSDRVLTNIGLYNVVDCIIQRNVAANAISISGGAHSGYGIMIYRADGATPMRNLICGNVVRDTQGSGIYVQGSRHTAITANVVENAASVQSDDTLLVGGIAAPSSAITISGNVIRGGASGRKAGIAIQGQDIVVSGNVIDGTRDAGIVLRGVTSSTVMGNSLRDCAGGVREWAGSTSVGVTIVGNSIWGGVAETSAHGMGFENLVASTVANNVVAEVQAYGIGVGGSRNVISGNVVRDASQSVADTYDGIYLMGTAVRNIVFGNHTYNSGAAGQRFGVLAGGALHAILGNDVAGNGQDGIVIVDPDALLAQNRWANGALRGTTALVAGTVCVATAEARPGSPVRVSRLLSAGDPGHLSVTVDAGGGAFDITSSSGTDSSTVLWEILH